MIKDFLFFVLGYLTGHIHADMTEKKKETGEADSYNLSDCLDGVRSLDHGDPFYKTENFVMEAPDEDFFLQMPEDIYYQIIAKAPKYDNTGRENPPSSYESLLI